MFFWHSLSPLNPAAFAIALRKQSPRRRLTFAIYFLAIHSAYPIYAYKPFIFLVPLIPILNSIFDSLMWSAIRPSPARWLRAPDRALSSSFTRGRTSPRGPRNSIRRPEPIPNTRREGAQIPHPESSNGETSNPAANYDPSKNTLLSPVHIPEDPNAVLKENHPAIGILANSGLVVQRQLELMNVMM